MNHSNNIFLYDDNLPSPIPSAHHPNSWIVTLELVLVLFISAREPLQVLSERNLGQYLFHTLYFIDEGSWPLKVKTCPESHRVRGEAGPRAGILSPLSPQSSPITPRPTPPSLASELLSHPCTGLCMTRTRRHKHLPSTIFIAESHGNQTKVK